MATRIFAELEAGVEVASPAETAHLAAALAAALPREAFVALQGPLGAGKTTFVRGLARAWAITGPVTSPTYNLLLRYTGSRTLLHLDAYRLDSPAVIDGLMLEDFLVAPYALVVEWPENLGDWLPADTLWLRFTVTGEESRRIQALPGNPEA